MKKYLVMLFVALCSISLLGEEADVMTERKVIKEKRNARAKAYLNMAKECIAEKKHKEAFKYLQMAAQQGNATSQYLIANYYYYGSYGVVEKDNKEAAKWYRKAAKQNYNKAEAQLSRMYAKGEVDGKVRTKKAAKLAKKSRY